MSHTLTLERLLVGAPPRPEPPQAQVLERVREHDRYQVEIKQHYPLAAGGRLSYEVSTYIFIPFALGIDETSYPIDEFYRCTQQYTRLSLKARSLRELTRGANSTFKVIERALKGNNTSDASAIRSLKLLCVVFQKALSLQLPSRGESKKSNVIAINELLTETERILDRHRALRSVLADRSEELEAAYQFTAERMSILAGDALLKCYDFVLRRFPEHALIDGLSEAIERENTHRQALNPQFVLSPTGANKEFLSRDSFLKKYVSSVLYLDSERGTEGATLEHVIYALAAGIAMIFATAATFYSQQVFGAYTLPVFCALVFSYMFKDRIKEIGRAHLGRYLRDRLSDRRTEIRAADRGSALGFIRETVRHLPTGKVPPEIKASRHSDPAGLAESVLRYTKQVVLSAQGLEELEDSGAEIAGVTDILRYDVRPYLHRMDDPIETRLCWADNRLQQVRCQKNYIVELVSAQRHSGAGAVSEFQSTTLVLNRKGIKRVEHN
jgi:hypothetical protein